MIKDREISDPDSCLNRSAPDEPVFVICARDYLALRVVRAWITAYAADPAHSRSKLADAISLRNEMQAWRDAHRDRVKIPD